MEFKRIQITERKDFSEEARYSLSDLKIVD